MITGREVSGRRGPVGGDYVHVLRPVHREADVVETGEQPGDPARRLLALVGVVQALGPGAGGEGDLPAVR
jgi:hypothetical protein